MYRRIDAAIFNRMYDRYNRRRFVSPDPLEFLYHYDDPADREVVALLAASLAYGRVAQILKSVAWVLDRLGPAPAAFISACSRPTVTKTCKGFRHRFCDHKHMAAFLWGIRGVLHEFGSLEACFARHVPAWGEQAEAQTLQSLHKSHKSQTLSKTSHDALVGFVGDLRTLGAADCGHMLADPAKGSACKRLHLFLRWQVRSDSVDPGGWQCIDKQRLVIPLDTHMHKIGSALGMTCRKQADIRAAAEITAAFRRFCPDDPVKYDFGLTRLGIRQECDMEAFLAECRQAAGRAQG